MGQKVLVADDSGVLLKIISRALFNCGVHDSDVVTAMDGKEAFEKFQTDDFSLVLTDWNMPIRTGLEFLNDIRSTGSQVPVIMVTTEAERCRVVEAVKAGVGGYLMKPFEQKELRDLVSKFLAESELSTSTRDA